MDWENNKVGKAVKAYRSAFTKVNDLVGQESSILSKILPVAKRLNKNINEQKKFIENVVSQQVIEAADESRGAATTIIFAVATVVGLLVFISLGGVTRQLYMQLQHIQIFLKGLAEGDFSQTLKLNNNNIPAIPKTKNNIISKISFSIFREPPINAKGIDPIKYGISNLKFKFPALI